MFEVHHWTSVLIFSILNHPRFFLVYSYPFGGLSPPADDHFKVIFYLKATFYDANNDSKYRDVAPL